MMHTCAETWACCSDYKSVKAATGGKGQAHQQNAKCDDGDEYGLHNRLRNTECRSSACFQAIVGDGQRSSSPESPREKVRNAAATRTGMSSWPSKFWRATHTLAPPPLALKTVALQIKI